MRIQILDLQPGTNYVIRARSKSGNEISNWSRTFPFTTTGDSTPPKTPTNVTNVSVGTAFKFAWDVVTLSEDMTPANDLAGYIVKVSSPDSGIFRLYKTVDNKMDFSFENNMAVFGPPQARIRVEVAAFDSVGNASPYSVPVLATNPAPSAVTGLSGAPQVDGISIRWNENTTDTDLKGYEVDVSTTGESGTYAKTHAGLSTSFVYPTSLYGVDHWFKTYSVDVFGTRSLESKIGPLRPSSAFGVDSTAPAIPAGLAASLAASTDGASAIASVSWTAVADTDGDLAEYILDYRPVGAPQWQTLKYDYTKTATTIYNLSIGVGYEFRIRSSDFSANLSNWSSSVTATAAANTAPSTPSAPAASSGVMRVLVTHAGTKAGGGAMESDVVMYEVYASTTSGFGASSSNFLGNMPVSPVIGGSWQLPAGGNGTTETWYVRVIAVDRGGLKSPQSAQATATPGLIQSTNIADATIGTAKIIDLDANKIKAGSGFINDLVVKSKFTLGDSGTVGAIESYGYVAGSTGFRFDKNLLEINQGAIAAAALKIQDGQNMVLPQFAGFEFVPTFYSNASNIYQGAAGTTISIQTSGAKNGGQFLRAILTTAAASTIYLSPSATTYNHELEPQTTYIYSAWVKTGAVATSVKLKVKSSAATTDVGSAVALPANGSWQRIYGTFDTGTSPNIIPVISIETATVGASVDIDSVQIERKIAGLTTPSPWSPPGTTSIDGGIIRTGEIRSNTNTVVNGQSQPNWSINMSGNAQFGDAMVRGRMLVGQSGPDVDDGKSFISSGNFVKGSTGWKIDSAGNLEANNGIFRGDLGAGIIKGENFQVGLINTNLVLDGSFEENYTMTLFDPWNTTGSGGTAGNINQWRYEGTSGATYDKATIGKARSGSRALTMTQANASSEAAVWSNSFRVKPNTKYKITLWAVSQGAAANVGVQAYKESTATGPNASAATFALEGLGDYGFSPVPAVSGTTLNYSDFTPVALEMTVPAGETQLWCALRIFNYNTSTTNISLIIDDVSVVEMGGGGASELTAAGLRIFSSDGDEVASLTTNNPNYFMVNKMVDGQLSTVAQITGDGFITGADLSIQDDPEFGGQRLIGPNGATGSGDVWGRNYEAEPLGLLENYSKGNISPFTYTGLNFTKSVATGQSYYLFSTNATLEPYREYKYILSSFLVEVTALGTGPYTVQLQLKRTIDGTDPSMSNGYICGYWNARPTTTGFFTVGIPVRRMYNNSSTEQDYRIGVFINATNCTARLYQAANNIIDGGFYDVGPMRYGDSAVMNQVTGGAAPAPSKKTYVTTWNATNSASYGLNSGSTYSVRSPNTGRLYHGRYSSNQGDQFAHILFGGTGFGGQAVSLATAMSGATIKKVELRVRNLESYQSVISGLRFRANTATSLSATANTGAAKTYSMNRGFFGWVDITSVFGASHRSVNIGPSSTNNLASLGSYSAFANHAAAGNLQLRVTYVK